MANNKKSLQTFAQVIERKLNASKGPDAMANLVCRLITSKDPKIASQMAGKWVEWRYGKATETVNVFGQHQQVMIVRGMTDERINALKQSERLLPETSSNGLSISDRSDNAHAQEITAEYVETSDPEGESSSN